MLARCHEATIRRAVRDGALQAVRLGGTGTCGSARTSSSAGCNPYSHVMPPDELASERLGPDRRLERCPGVAPVIHRWRAGAANPHGHSNVDLFVQSSTAGTVAEPRMVTRSFRDVDVARCGGGDVLVVPRDRCRREATRLALLAPGGSRWPANGVGDRGVRHGCSGTTHKHVPETPVLSLRVVHRWCLKAQRRDARPHRRRGPLAREARSGRARRCGGLRERVRVPVVPG